MNDPSKRLSPAWKNPRDVLRKRAQKRRKLASATLPIQGRDEDNEQFLIPSTSASQGKASAIRNPFRILPRKRLHQENPSTNKDDTPAADLISDSNALQEFPTSVFDRMKRKSSASLQENKSAVAEPMPIDFSSIEEFKCSTPKKKILRSEETKTKVDSLPIDFRLGLKLRLESCKPFFWLASAKREKGEDYASAIRLFCSPPSEAGKLATETGGRAVSDASRFLACTLYWQFPDIAWQASFPRLDSQPRLTATRDAPAPNLFTFGEPLVKALSQQWLLAFQQLYSSWRTGARPYFYVCCPTLTILFWKTTKGAVELDENTALGDDSYDFRVVCTPTTFGFRQKLREDGVRYEMPFRRRSRRSSSGRSSNAPTDSSLLDITQSQPPLLGGNRLDESKVSTGSSGSRKRVSFAVGDDDSKENTGETEKEEEKEEKTDKDDEGSNDTICSNDTDNDEWMKDLGISPSKVKKITRTMSVVSSRSLDHELSLSQLSQDPDALVLDESTKSAVVLNDPNSISAFFNLMNAPDFGRAATGPQAGFPPTLLAREPFLHSVLKNLTYKYQEYVKDGINRHVCELEDGPVMPHMMTMFENFLRKSGEGNAIEGKISGRYKCAGMNEVVNLGGAANYRSFEFRLGAFFKS